VKKPTLKIHPMKTCLFSIIFFLTITISLFSCEADKHISVKVIDAITKKPVDSVFIKIKAGKNGDYHKNYKEGYTDTSGKFETNMMIGCSFGCYDIYVEYYRRGYENKIDFNITEGTVLLNPKSIKPE